MSNSSIKVNDVPVRESAYGLSREPTFSSVQSFMRRKSTKDLKGAELVISGIPFNLAVTYRSGARLGPQAIRQASAEVASLKPYPWGFDPFERLSVIDFGDCFLDVHNPMSVHAAIVQHAQHILQSGARMLTFGGDHYITYPLLKAHAEKFGQPLSLIHFDAHCDTWPDDHAESLNHGSMFFKAINDGLIDPKRSVQIGIRTWNDDFMGVNILDARWVHDHNSAAAIAEIERIVGSHPAYLTFDIDCLDPAFAPGTGTPVVDGLTPGEVFDTIRALGNINVVGMDLVEVSPPYDPTEITALFGASVILEHLCERASRLPDKRAS